jgi:hypothetical protein
MAPAHCSAIAFAMPGNVLLLTFARSSGGNLQASAYQAGIVFPLLKAFRVGGDIIFVGFNFGNPLSHKQVFFSKGSPYS